MYRPSVSVIVNTYNRADYLADALRGLDQLDYENHEIVVVNGPSEDATGDVLASWSDRVKIADCGAANLSMSRNIGIAEASGDIVAFLDDDAIPHPKWLGHLVSHYADRRVGGVGGFTVDNTGTHFQCRKTLCDRFGNAHYVPAFFDERTLNRPGSPVYPSMLGTNSSFRRETLVEIGGFDHTFAYLLDETDVCLRIVDAGFKIVYEASALVFHQFAASHIRTSTRVARTVYPSAVSKAYFVMRHGVAQSVEDAGRNLDDYRREILNANQWLAESGTITAEHRVSLDQDLLVGIREGTARASAASARKEGNLVEPAVKTAFKKYPTTERLRVALVSQDFPPDKEAGIARWTWMMATGLADRGHAVHVISRAGATPFTRFENGYWVHAVADDPVGGEILATEHRIPLNIAARAASVRTAVSFVKSFGLDVLSFPIWDIEGIGCVDDPHIGVVMSLHTSYGLAKPHKREWNMRPLFEHFAVNTVIAAERRLLETVPTLLANSEAIISDLRVANDVEFADRPVLCPHGTTDPFVGNPQRQSLRRNRPGQVRLLYVGRFEMRKGFDIAAKVFERLLRKNLDISIDIVGDDLTPATEAWLQSVGAQALVGDKRVRFRGLVDRTALDDLYCSADVVLMPSRYESFGLVAVEALAAGAPVVTSKTGGLSEVVEDDVSGFLIPLDGGEVEAFMAKTLALIRDRELRTRLSLGARKAFEERFTLGKMIDGVEAALWQVQRGGRRHGT